MVVKVSGSFVNIEGTSSPTKLSKYRTRNCRRASSTQKMHNINMLVANVHML